MNQGNAAPRRRPRCAIYTRKSSEEGLEQDFNSLDAQREACEAYIASQKAAGWQPIRTPYDDGGLSGATMDRPALQRLLADIKAGRVDVVVVYKVDRLTRSLADFAKIVETFDAHGVSFVSVTQQFNTTTSMGRLTLNVLLSFAQFEREVTGERIRDKIAASKKKGMWMGGTPPLGYDAKDRALVVNEAEAETVRHIFRRYAALGSVHRLKEELDAQGIVGKVWVSASGRRWGGTPLARGALYRLLQNRLYRGEIVHKGTGYPGAHAAIVDPELWGQVQARLAANARDCQDGVRAAEPSLLAGRLFDGEGHRMTPSHAVKRGRRYRYYVSRPLTTAGRSHAPSGRRIPAGDIERLVADRIRIFLADPAQVYEAIRTRIPAPAAQQRCLDRAAALAIAWSDQPPARSRAILRTVIARINLRSDRVELHLRPARLIALLQADDDRLPAWDDRTADSQNSEEPLILSAHGHLRRLGLETRLRLEGLASRGTKARPDPGLIRLLAKAHRLHGILLRSDARSLGALADRVGLSGSYVTRLLRLAYLAPDITRAILDGHQPAELTAAKLVRQSRLPLAWSAQRRALGFA